LRRLWKTNRISLPKLCRISQRGSAPRSLLHNRFSALTRAISYRFGEPILVKGVVAHLPGAAGAGRQ
jgi:hypothetical protein